MTVLNEERLDEVIRALAHSDRRRFVKACMGSPRAAGELAQLSSLALASVSEHLKVLRKSGLLVLQKEGRFRMYRTDTALLHHVGRAIIDFGSQE